MNTPGDETVTVFRAACARGELHYHRCADCGRAQLHPRRHCGYCHGHDLAWQRSAGQGEIFSHTTVHRAPNAAFVAQLPYVIVLIDMAEGFRLMTNLLDCEPANVRIGLPVRLIFREDASGRWLPQAVPVA